VPIESTRQISQLGTIPGKKCVEYAYEIENGEKGGGSGKIPIDWLFPDNRTGISDSIGYSYSEDGLADLRIEVFILNEDGTVTFVVYQPKG
nr:hypothetical protein [Lachnospiraceae bacterium]